MENDTKQPSMDLLEAFQMVIPYLNRLVHEDITVGVYDHEKLLLNVPASTFSIDVKKGDPLVEGDIVTEAIRQNNDQVQIVPKELFGFPLMARAIPLHDEQGNVIGGVGVGISLEKANELFLVADSLSAIVEQTAASLEEIAKSVTILADQVSDSNNMIVRVIDGAEEIGTISSVVKGISDQSNLLGLNAAIEAARAGDHGKGFSVVAEEIRKLALNSKENVNEIEQIMKKIKEAVENLQLSFTDIHSLTTSQAATIEELSATVQEINRNAQNLSEMAERSLKN